MDLINESTLPMPSVVAKGSDQINPSLAGSRLRYSMAVQVVQEFRRQLMIELFLLPVYYERRASGTSKKNMI